MVKRALVVAGWYPPCQAWPTAARRISDLVEGIAARGWQVTVLAPDRRELCVCERCRAGDVEVQLGAAEVRRIPIELTRVRRRTFGRTSRLPAGGDAQQTQVQRAAPNELRRTMWAMLGSGNNWRHVAVEAGKREQPDVVVTTAGPFENIGVGRDLQQRLGIPWVADLRDPASRDATLAGARYELLVRAARRRFRTPLRKADLIVSATNQVVEFDGPWLGREIELLLPGYDEAAFSLARAEARVDPGRFEIVYTGHLYGGYRGPHAFLRGLRRFADHADSDGVTLVYHGRSGGALLAAADELGCRSLVEDRGFIAPDEVALRLASASLLLLLTNEAAHSGVPGGKFFEYLGAHRPILAVPGGDTYAEEVLNATGAGQAASSPDEIASVLRVHIEAWRQYGATPFLGDLDAIAAYSSEHTADRFAQLLDAVVVRT